MSESKQKRVRKPATKTTAAKTVRKVKKPASDAAPVERKAKKPAPKAAAKPAPAPEPEKKTEPEKNGRKAISKVSDKVLIKAIEKFCDGKDEPSFWACVRELRNNQGLSFSHARLERLWVEIP